ncbi:MAG: response regulator [bacterium]|nr:response regulator [bacterium]
MKILIVDDSVVNRRVTADMLESVGYSEIAMADSAEEAFNLLGLTGKGTPVENIDLILMDMVMPGMSGIEACRKIKAVESLKDIPVIMITALKDNTYLQLAFEAGVDNYLTKPLSSVELLARVRSALKLKAEIDKIKEKRESLLEVTEELRHSNERLSYFEKAIHNMQIGLTITDTEGKIVYCNPAEAAMHQYGPDELAGRDVRTFAPKETWNPMGKSKLNNITSFRRETINVRKDGSLFPVQLLSDVVCNDQGEAIAVVSICEDITDRKRVAEELKEAHDKLEARVKERTEELTAANLSLKEEIVRRERIELSLRQSENEYRTLFQQFNILLNAIPDSLILFSKELKVLWANEGSSSIFSLEEKPAVGKHCTVVEQLCDEAERWPVKRCFESGKEETDELTSDDGKRINIRAFPILDADGNVENVLELLIDVTEMVSLQAEAMRAGHLASIGELSAGVAHEINNPINGIINCAQLVLNRCSGDKKLEELAQMIIKEGRRIAKIVEALLSFARKRGERLVPVDLNEVLSDSLALTEAHLRKDGIALHVEFPSTLPKVRGNDQQIEQVFLNLINNARYALNERPADVEEEKFLKIKAALVNVDKKSYVRVSFHDNGPGISSGIMKRVIDPFFSTKPHKEGTGLGLSISHGIVNDHGGKLSIDSKEGSYTNVVVELPIKEEG